MIWSRVVPARAVSLERCTLLEAALAALDRAEAAREVIEREGMVAVTAATGALHLNPLCKLERENRQLFGKLWGVLGLDADPRELSPFEEAILGGEKKP